MDADQTASPRGEDSLKSLRKVIRILESFSTVNRTMSLGEICQRIGFPKSTAHRLLFSMRTVGLLDQDREGGRYRLGLKLFEFGNTVLANMDLHREARPFVDTLARVSGQMVHLAVFDGRHAVVIQRSDPSPEGLPASFIETAPVHCTSVGKAILAYQPEDALRRVLAAGLQRYTDTTIVEEAALRAALSEIRNRGYSVDEGEHQPGIRCIGAPIPDQSGRIFAAVSVSGPSWRIPAGEVASLSKIVVHNANAIAACLGYRPEQGGASLGIAV